jgi:hypothetical protein
MPLPSKFIDWWVWNLWWSGSMGTQGPHVLHEILILLLMDSEQKQRGDRVTREVSRARAGKGSVHISLPPSLHWPEYPRGLTWLTSVTPSTSEIKRNNE